MDITENRLCTKRNSNPQPQHRKPPPGLGLTLMGDEVRVLGAQHETQVMELDRL